MKITSSQLAEKMFSSMKLAELTAFEKKQELHTGITDIDTDFGFPSGYYVIIGNQGVGKSWFALWLSRMFYRHDQVTSVYFSLEMPKPLVRKRILQQWSDLTKSELETGSSMTNATKLMSEDIIVVDEFYSQDTAKQKPASFKQWVADYYALGYRVFLMDHFHELSGASVNDTNQKTVAEWGLTFQQLCKQYPDIWLVVFAQPNSKDFGKQILNRNSLRGSKALIDKCDYVLTLNKSIKVDTETGLVIKNQDDRKVILYLDKTRYTESPNIGFRLYFAPTGNFYSTSTRDQNV